MIEEKLQQFDEQFVKKATDWRENNGWTVDYVNSRADNIKSFLISFYKEMIENFAEELRQQANDLRSGQAVNAEPSWNNALEQAACKLDALIEIKKRLLENIKS